MADQSKPGPDKAEADHRAKARAASEAKDKEVEQAVFDATHDKDGNPIPLGGVEEAEELPEPPGIKVVQGKP